MTYRILIIDDDEVQSAALGSHLRAQGMRVERRATARGGLSELVDRSYDAVILDATVEDVEPLEVCRQVRARWGLPVLMLAPHETALRGVGVTASAPGPDAYFERPVAPGALIQHLQAMLGQRGPALAGSAVLRFGRLEIDRARREVRLDGQVRELTARQFALLVVLAESAGQIQSREELTEAVRGIPLGIHDRSIDVHISRIRAAIEDDPHRPRRIKTVRSVGYVFVAEQD